MAPKAQTVTSTATLVGSQQPTKQSVKGTRLSPLASEFISVSWKKNYSGPELSPLAAFLATASTPVRDLSPEAPCFTPSSTTWSTYDSEWPITPSTLSPWAEPFCPVPPTCTICASKLSPYAAPFVPSSGSTEGTLDLDGILETVRLLQSFAPHEIFVGGLHPAVLSVAVNAVNYVRTFATLKKCKAAIVAHEKTLDSLAVDFEQQMDACRQQYIAFVHWREYERYGKPCPDQEPSFSGFEEFKSRRRDRLLQGMQESQGEYECLIEQHDLAVDVHNDTMRLYNASVVAYYAWMSGNGWLQVGAERKSVLMRQPSADSTDKDRMYVVDMPPMLPECHVKQAKIDHRSLL